uniref:Uncharacterized protein n=1 Tax=Rhizophagus irregularis (strain DAOM 181602 / DAOM 197198 / MUCL 43194) TaxID=747089 RepID=U9THI8_RHIID
MAHNSSNNFGDNVYESNSQKTVAQTYDTYLPVMPVTYCDNVNNPISDQISNTISPNQQPNVSSPNHQQPTSIYQQQYDANYANYANYQQCNNQQSPIYNYFSDNNIIFPDQQPNAASPNHNQQYDNAISNYSDNVTNSPDQQPNVSSPNHNQQYHQHHSVASPNHQQQYDASYQQYIYQTAISNNTDSIIPVFLVNPWQIVREKLKLRAHYYCQEYNVFLDIDDTKEVSITQQQPADILKKILIYSRTKVPGRWTEMLRSEKSH